MKETKRRKEGPVFKPKQLAVSLRLATQEVQRQSKGKKK